MPDTQILNPKQVSAPSDYVIPPAAEIILKSVSASFDGSGASGAFLPAVEIESDAGRTVVVCPAPSVAAGASADVSWFRGGTVASGSGVGDELAHFQMQLLVGDITGSDRATSNLDFYLDVTYGGGLAFAFATWACQGDYVVNVQVTNLSAHDCTLNVNEVDIQTVGSTARELVGGAASVLSPANSGEVQLPIDTKVFGSNLVDLTEPLTTFFPNAGTYAVGVTVAGFF